MRNLPRKKIEIAAILAFLLAAASKQEPDPHEHLAADKERLAS